jgi:hypothetical protein
VRGSNRPLDIARCIRSKYRALQDSIRGIRPSKRCSSSSNARDISIAMAASPSSRRVSCTPYLLTVVLISLSLTLLSWLEVTDTTLASTSDEVLIAKLKCTAYYRILQSISENKSTSETIQSPLDSLIAFSLESLQARFRQDSQDSINALQHDYDTEVHRASQIVEMGMARGWFDDISRLIKEEQELAEQSQDAMEDDSHFLTVY